MCELVSSLKPTRLLVCVRIEDKCVSNITAMGNAGLFLDQPLCLSVCLLSPNDYYNIRSAANFSLPRLVLLSCLCLNWEESLGNNGRQFPLNCVAIYHVSGRQSELCSELCWYDLGSMQQCVEVYVNGSYRRYRSLSHRYIM